MHLLNKLTKEKAGGTFFTRDWPEEAIIDTRSVKQCCRRQRKEVEKTCYLVGKTEYFPLPKVHRTRRSSPPSAKKSGVRERKKEIGLLRGETPFREEGSPLIRSPWSTSPALCNEENARGLGKLEENISGFLSRQKVSSGGRHSS